MDTKEIIRIALNMEKSLEDRRYEDLLALLGDLHEAHVSAEQLETTDVVKVLYRVLKTCPDSSLKKTAKALLATWKRQYGKDRKDVKRTEEGEASTSSSPLSPVRSKCVQLLSAALSAEHPDREKVAEEIERHVHELHKSNAAKYKACIRSKVANLRNPKSSHLQQGLLGGLLSPEAFARMSVEEMASEELQRLREEYSSRGVSERQLPQGVEGTKTQKIRCKRCGASDCSVAQVSRGALFLPAWVRGSGPDEDAMTFVTCRGCGQQWYHSGWICL